LGAPDGLLVALVAAMMISFKIKRAETIKQTKTTRQDPSYIR
jgi:hypothetical protein